MPVRDVLVRDSRCDIEHDDTALAVDVVAIAQATELLLTRSIPDVELDRAKILRTGQRVTLRRDIRDRQEGSVRTVVKPRG